MVWAAITSHPVIRWAALAVAWTSSSGVHAQTLSAGQGEASVEVLAPLGVTQEQQLGFGRIVVGSGGGTVTLDPTGSLHCADGLLCIDAAEPAVFRVAGGEAARLDHDLGAALSGPGEAKLALTLDVVEVAAAFTPCTREIRVGGSLLIPADSPPGEYRGTYEISVTYE